MVNTAAGIFEVVSRKKIQLNKQEKRDKVCNFLHFELNNDFTIFAVQQTDSNSTFFYTN